jgi:hypothetical protein
MRHPRLQEFEACLRRLFGVIDEHLENKYGDRYRLHPSRPARGTTARAETDGLFNIGATFTPGYGSKIGRGYVVQVDLVTLDSVPGEVREEIEQEVADLVNEKLPFYFPDRDLRVDRDRNVYKIHGDLRLGEI